MRECVPLPVAVIADLIRNLSCMMVNHSEAFRANHNICSSCPFRNGKVASCWDCGSSPQWRRAVLGTRRGKNDIRCSANEIRLRRMIYGFAAW